MTFLDGQLRPPKFHLEMDWPADAGPSGERKKRRSQMARVTCQLCGMRFQCLETDAGSLALHAERCLDWNAGAEGEQRVVKAGRGGDLLTCGDVEANPGPAQGPSAGGSGKAILQELMENGLQHIFQLFVVKSPERGPCGEDAPSILAQG